jgi:hypothetical protein
MANSNKKPPAGLAADVGYFRQSVACQIHPLRMLLSAQSN